MPTPLVLIAEDAAVVAVFYADALDAAGYLLLIATQLADGLLLARAAPLAAAVVDVRLRDGDDGKILAEDLAAGGVPVIVMAGYEDDLSPAFVERVRPASILRKPFAREALLAAVDAALGGVRS